jgi:hypothetical protein
MLRTWLDYIVVNKEWIFSGVGMVVLVGIMSGLKSLLWRPNQKPATKESAPKPSPTLEQRKSNPMPSHWQGIIPEGSKYQINTEMRDYIQMGPQTYTFEYGPSGHAKPIRFSDGSLGQLVIMFTCEISNPYLAAFAAGGEFALNVLPAKFLVGAREILEKTAAAAIRRNREDVSARIRTKMMPEFEAVGVRLINVSIDSIDKLERVASKRATR